MPESGLVDFSKELGLDWPATMPNLLAGNNKLGAGESTLVAETAGALVLLVLDGSGALVSQDETVELHPGDIALVPGGQGIRATAGDTGLSYFLLMTHRWSATWAGKLVRQSALLSPIFPQSY